MLASAQAYDQPDIVTIVTAIYAKFGFAPVPLADNGGPARISFGVAPGVEGVYPVQLITSALNPAFGMLLIDGTFLNQIPCRSITIVIPDLIRRCAALAAARLLRRRHRSQA